MNETEKKIVIYDDGCPTCTVGMEFAEKHDSDGAFTFVGMNTEEGQALIVKHQLDMSASAYVVHDDGSHAEKARMMVEIFSRAGFLGLLVSLPFRVPILGNWLYGLLALHRKHATKTEK